MSIKTLLYVVSANSLCTGRWRRQAVSLACPELDSVALLYLWCFTVVRLRLSEAACVTPVTRAALCCWSDLGAWAWPEPTVHVGRLQVRSVASIEVALAAGRPDVTHIACKELFLYRVIKKFLCTWWLQLSQHTSFLPHYLAQSDCLAADRQGHGDTRLTLKPSVIPNSNYVIVVSDWNCLKYLIFLRVFLL
jgi:hypothetical protein